MSGKVIEKSIQIGESPLFFKECADGTLCIGNQATGAEIPVKFEHAGAVRNFLSDWQQRVRTRNSKAARVQSSKEQHDAGRLESDGR